MQFLNYILSSSFNKIRYFIFLAISTIIYFISSNIFQNKIGYNSSYGEFSKDAFYNYIFFPEPYEIPLYFLSYLAIPLLALFFYFTYNYLYKKKILKHFLIILLALLVYSLFYLFTRLSLPNFNFFKEYAGTHSISHILWLLFTKRLYIFRITLVSTIIFFVFIYRFFKNLNSNIFIKFSNAPIFKKMLPWFFILLAVILFTPNFPFEEGHCNYVLGTVNDILNGKQFLYNTTNQYGILNIYFVAFILKYLLPLSYASFSLILFFSFYFFIVAVFFLIKKWLNSYLFAYLGSISVLAINYFIQTGPFWDSFLFPGPTPFRYGFHIIVAFFVYKFAKQKTKFWRESLIAVSAIALFWNIDTGLWVTISAFITLLYIEIITAKNTWLQKINKFTILAFKFALYIGIVFGLINLVNYLIFHSWPNWGLIIDAMTVYEKSGVGKIPMPKIGIFEIYTFAYLNILLYVLYKIIKNKFVDPVLIFLLFFGIFHFTYYAGNSTCGYLPAVSTPLILISIYLFRNFFQQKTEFQDHNPQFTKLITALFYSLLFFISFLLIFKIPTVFAKKNYLEIKKNFNELRTSQTELYDDALIINKKYKNLDKIPLLHIHGARLLIIIKKVNYFDFYDISNLSYKKQARAIVIKKIYQEKPEFIFMGREKEETHLNKVIKFIEPYINELYEKFESLNTLDIYRLKSKNNNVE